MILQKILFPDARFCADYEMYVRMTNAPSEGSYYDAQRGALFLKKGQSAFFNTLFNAFSIEKWLKYTHLETLSLRLVLSGTFCVRIHRQQLVNDALVDTLLEERICRAVEEEAFVFDLPCTASPRGIYSAELEAMEDGAFWGGAYETDEAASRRDISIAVDICTFKREAFVARNVALLSEAIIHNPDSALHDRLEIFISDNARTLNAAVLASEHVHIFPNKNAGGAGGFARGMMEILKRPGVCTHVLVMDDDVLISPEALERTARFLSLMKPEYFGKTVAGAMMRLDKRNFQHENGACWNGRHTESVHTYMDMCRLENVIENEREQPVDFNAWWYSCIPIEKISFDNLPLPLFIRFDDVEFGLRTGSDIVMLNGVCLWHEPFEYKYSGSMEYYHMRNGLIVDAMHCPDMTGRRAARHMVHMALSNLVRYRYGNVELLLRGVDDFLSGAQAFMKLEPETLHREIMAQGDKFVPLSELDVPFDQGRYLANYARLNTPAHRALRGDEETLAAPPAAPRHRLNAELFRHWLRRLTANGLLLPAGGENVVNAVANVTSDFFRKSAVLNYDPIENRGFVSRRDTLRSFKLLVRIYGKAHALKRGYKAAAEDFRAFEPELTARAFWEGYLGIDAGEEK